MLTKRYSDTNFITGMRAYAALAVVLIHAGGAGLRELGPLGNAIADFGGAGVHVFFVISGFSVASSFKSSSGYADYLSKRIWRIAPLYYFWIATAFAVAALKGEAFRPYNLFMHLSFLGFLDYRVTNSVLSVEWSISIEVFWYFVVPILLGFCNTAPRAIVAFLFALSTYESIDAHANILPVPPGVASLALHWSPIPYAVSYCLGIAAYQIRRQYAVRPWVTSIAPILASLLILGYVTRVRALIGAFYDEMTFASVLSFMLVTVGTDRSSLFRWLFCNRAVQFIGIVSYGVYLSHPVLLGLLRSIAPKLAGFPLVLYVLVSGAAIAVSAATHVIIERPAQRFGRFLWQRAPISPRAPSRSTPTCAHAQGAEPAD